MSHSLTRPLPEPIWSTLRDDSDFRELLKIFVDAAAEHRVRLQSCFAAADYAELRRFAHQLKGAGGGYGFPLVTELAGRLESACDDTLPDFLEIARRLRVLDDCLSRLRA